MNNYIYRGLYNSLRNFQNDYCGTIGLQFAEGLTTGAMADQRKDIRRHGFTSMPARRRPRGGDGARRLPIRVRDRERRVLATSPNGDGVPPPWGLLHVNNHAAQ